MRTKIGSTKALPFLFSHRQASFPAKSRSYHLSLKNCRDDLHIEKGYLWRREFLGFGWRGKRKRQGILIKVYVPKVLICSGYGKFLAW
jgi:hypothetical protein